MSIKRLTPVVNYRDLGILRLWRDDLAEIVKYVRQLSDVTLRIEADGFELEDVDADLPTLGKRLGYFSLTAWESGFGSPVLGREVLNVYLSRKQCFVEAKDPDANTRGILGDITSLTDNCRRLPRWISPRRSGASSTNRSQGATTGHPATRSEDSVETLLQFLTLGSFVFTILAWISIGQHASGVPNKHVIISSPASMIAGIISPLVLCIAIAILSRWYSVIATGTRIEAPTFWERNRAGIAINIIVALVSGGLFLWLGTLIGHG